MTDRRRPHAPAHVHSWLKMRDLRREMIQLATSGMLQRDIAKSLDVSQQLVSLVLSPMGGVYRVEDWHASDARLSLEDRIEIGLGCQRGESFRATAHPDRSKSLDDLPRGGRERGPAVVSTDEGPSASSRAGTQTQADQALSPSPVARPRDRRPEAPVVS